MKREHYIISVRNFKVFAFLVLLMPLYMQGQVELEKTSLVNSLRTIPQEGAFVHYNSSFLLAGESLFYKFYLLNRNSIGDRPLSKIAYLELQGKDGAPIFRHKLKLNEGTGEGDFFIPTSVASGNYKLVGYTRWMLNGDNKNIFEGDLVIINPYLNTRNNLLVDEEISPKVITTSSSYSGNSEKNSVDSRQTLGAYNKRQLVQIDREKMPGMDPNGSYSISIRRKLGLEVPNMADSEGAINSGTAFIWDPENSIFLPELRGEIINGRIIPIEGSDISSLKNRKVALSIPGEDFVLKIVKTDEKGNFIFLVEANTSVDKVLLQVLGKDRSYFDIQLQPSPRAKANSFPHFQLHPEMEKIIVKESVYNQIENGYFSAKADTLEESKSALPFYGDLLLTYYLDDYTRFNTLKEVLVEIVKDIALERNEKGEYLKTRGENALVESNMSSLLLVDGVLVQDHDLLINYPARKIYSIGLLREKYFYGSEVFHGVIHVRTVGGDFFEQQNLNYLKTTELLRPRPKKKYFKQSYNNVEEQSRIPDFRRQLLWDPNFNFPIKHLEFYTSDVAGEYEIVVQGFSTSGAPLTIRKTFTVK